LRRIRDWDYTDLENVVRRMRKELELLLEEEERGENRGKAVLALAKAAGGYGGESFLSKDQEVIP
jgi:hypothetical protein